MITELTHAKILVKDYEEAIQWYQDKLGFELRDNFEFAEGQRWVTMGLPGQKLEFNLFPTSQGTHDARLQTTGEIIGWVFHSTDARKDIEDLRAKGVEITLEPEDQMWGTQAGFKDLYGNDFMLVQPPQQ
ncbi:VOC family protein [Tumebacillus permanentifrigoris]|uniref:Putative glyoxalase superfamily protein PhnB n=1 Tax=Tumebacillus permanentifrigoris TaxID=378543 RepID=A0A316DDZ4_9BACL|nr:VOC family protein [Tumebacillus permanentifrigoris]PWK16431.1 putative glyoxalase superfamily protein PhnB [Tumebacillus permanentifrigoris]